MNPLLVISERDNVATALEVLEAGSTIEIGRARVTAIESIPRGHKIAIVPIHAGDLVMKYGSAIGIASSEIPAGAHVHTHNLSSARGRGDLTRDAESIAAPIGLPQHPRIAEPPEQ